MGKIAAISHPKHQALPGAVHSDLFFHEEECDVGKGQMSVPERYDPKTVSGFSKLKIHLLVHFGQDENCLGSFEISHFASKPIM